MGKRPAKTIRDPNDQPYTRYSRRKPRKSYIKAMPHLYVHVFRTGKRKEFSHQLDLVSLQPIQVRDISLEAARQSIVKKMQKLAPDDFYVWLRVFPHHVIRENKMLSGAGADRLQKGMKKAFGKPTNRAARLSKGTVVFSVYVPEKYVDEAKEVLRKASIKLSGDYTVEVRSPPEVLP